RVGKGAPLPYLRTLQKLARRAHAVGRPAVDAWARRAQEFANMQHLRGARLCPPYEVAKPSNQPRGARQPQQHLADMLEIHELALHLLRHRMDVAQPALECLALEDRRAAGE